VPLQLLSTKTVELLAVALGLVWLCGQIDGPTWRGERGAAGEEALQGAHVHEMAYARA
jgi:hypothetical protein